MSFSPGETHHPVKVVAGYALQQRLGSGSFAIVYKGARLPQTSADQPQTVAVKAISRTSGKLTPKVLQNLDLEISILRTYRHSNIVCMHNVIKTDRHFYLLLEYCAGGDVQGLIRSRKAGRLSEGLTRRLIRDLAQGLKFLWGQELIHRDLKPQNLLLTGPLPAEEVDDPPVDNLPLPDTVGTAFHLKIADFGFARHLQSASMAETLCGSPIYMAPEILQHQRYDAKADLWSVGTVLFEMISGKPPFHGENHIDLLRNIQRKAVRLPPNVKVSKECVNLLRLLLNRNPMSRAGFKEFFEACDALVALGCRGEALDDPGSNQKPTSELGTIPENEDETQHSVMTVGSVAPNLQEAVTTDVRSDMHIRRNLAPLIPSPPPTGNRYPNPQLHPPTFDLSAPEPERQLQMVDTSGRRGTEMQNSAGSFVMVEHGGPKPSSTAQLVPTGREPAQPRAEPAFFIGRTPILSGAREYFTGKQNALRGMLSTSPGTGGALLGMLGQGTRMIPSNEGPLINVESRIASMVKLLAASEDVGRRAISVAHLGDKQVYVAMRVMMMMNNESMSSLNLVPMEGIDEDDGGHVTDDSSTNRSYRGGRRRGSSCDKSMTEARGDEEMPFAVSSQTQPTLDATFPSRSRANDVSLMSNKSAPPKAKASPSVMQTHFREALSCYVKALAMLQGCVGGVTQVQKEIETLRTHAISTKQAPAFQSVQERVIVTSKWLNSQFNGVLERADAANSEIAKLPKDTKPVLTNVDELIYNHALACGREGAVKQLLGQNEAARSCYRTAGLLAETLLMEKKFDNKDRQTLEAFVDGFATRIIELDETIHQESRVSECSVVGMPHQMPLKATSSTRDEG